MGNIKISDLPVATEVQDTDEIVVSQGTGSGDVKSSTLAVLKTWVTDAVSVTGANGLSSFGQNAVGLGGTLEDFTVINLGDNSLRINDGTSAGGNESSGANFFLSSDSRIKLNLNSSTYNHIVNLENGFLNLQVEQNSTSLINGLSISHLTIQLQDGINNRGIVNAGDYEANFTGRSLVTKQYVDGKIPDTSGFATDANVVHKTGDESIDGNKVFTDNLTVGGLVIGTGHGSLGSNPNQLSNTAIGLGVMPTNTGQENTAVGQWALSSNTTGSNNTAFGAQALASASTAGFNTAIGVYALTSVTTAGGNTAVGAGALENTTGANNTALGIGAGGGGNGTGNVFIGYSTGANASGDNKLFIANSDTAAPLLFGDFSASTLLVNGTLSSTGAPVNPNDVVRLSDLSGFITSSDLATVTIPFTAGGTNPLVINTWAADYFPTYKNGSFMVQFKDSDGNLQDRPDIGIKRIIDRSGTPVQTGISMDQPDYPDGQIVITYSNFNLI